MRITARVGRHPAAATGLLMFATAIWGSTFIVVQDGINGMPMNPFMAWRFLIATAVMVALRPQALRMSREVLKQGLFIGIALSLGYWTQTYGLYFTSATVSGFITGMFVVLTPVAAWLVYRMKIGWVGTLAIALAVAGVALISLKGWSFGYGEALTLIGAGFFSFQIMWLSRWATPATSYSIATLQMATSCGFFWVAALVTDGVVLPTRPESWRSIVFLAVFASALAFIIQTWSQSQMTPTRAAVVLSTEPLFAGVFGVWIGGDSLTWRVVVGGAAILAAMFLIELGSDSHEAVDDLAEPHLGV